MSFRAILAAALLSLPMTSAANASEPTLEERVQRIEDEAAIRHLVLQYAALLDARKFDEYANLFAENGVWKNGPTEKHGRAEIRAMLDDIYGTPAPDFVNTESYRIVHNVEIAIDSPDHATGRSRQLTIMRGEGGSPTPRLSGIYEDEYIRENGEWKFLRRVDTVFMPTAAEWRQQMAELRAKQAEE